MMRYFICSMFQAACCPSTAASTPAPAPCSLPPRPREPFPSSDTGSRGWCAPECRRDRYRTLQVVNLTSDKGLENRRYWNILVFMAENLLEYAQKMAENARAGLAIERKRLQEILVERQRKQPAEPTQQSR